MRGEGRILSRRVSSQESSGGNSRCNTFGTTVTTTTTVPCYMNRPESVTKTTPAMKAGVGDVLQISSWMNSDSLLGDCRTGKLAVIEICIESVLCE